VRCFCGHNLLLLTLLCIAPRSRPEKTIAIAKRFGADPDKVLNNIVYARAYTHEQQESLLTAVAAKMIDERFAVLVRTGLLLPAVRLTWLSRVG